jgi:hypothetical protein
MTTITKQNQQLNKTTQKIEDKIVKSTPDTKTQDLDTLSEVRSLAEKAYQAYMDAQRRVATAYRERAYQEEKAYEEIEGKANRECTEAIEKAFKIRDKAEQEAEMAYQEAREKAAQLCQQKIEQALSVRSRTVQEAWVISRETSERIWKIFKGDGSL